jgi:hypothetical protein
MQSNQNNFSEIRVWFDKYYRQKSNRKLIREYGTAPLASSSSADLV